MENISIVQNKCVGCRSCEQVCPQNCISIQLTKEGFLYPNIKEDICVHCGVCLKACPTENIENHRNKPSQTWAFRNRNEADIMKSASGGVADVASKIILRQHGVVYGAAYDDDFVVKHIEVVDQDMRKKLQSSKYVQSDINDCYAKAKKQLAKGRTVLFTGTPCQIAGVYAFLGEDKPNLYTIDLICHGVPSPKLFQKYLEWQDKRMNGRVIYFNFRSKDKRGWGTQYLIETKTKRKTKTKTFSLDRYGKHFMAGDCYRECCYQCAYADIKRVGDITVGDFWGIVKSHPDFYSPKGVSSVFINTEKGKRLFEQIKEQADVRSVTLEEGLVKQGNLVKPTVRLASRNSFYKDVDTIDYIDKMKVGLQIRERIKAVLPAKTIQLIKQKLGGNG